LPVLMPDPLRGHAAPAARLRLRHRRRSPSPMTG